MNKFKSIARMMGKGFVRSIWGTAVSVSIGLSVYGYSLIPTEGGYVAVAEFMAATIFLCIALGCMYIMGGTEKKVAR
jgi:hypothetical protein